MKESLERGLDRGRERREGLGLGEREGGIVGLSDWGREGGREELRDWVIVGGRRKGPKIGKTQRYRLCLSVHCRVLLCKPTSDLDP